MTTRRRRRRQDCDVLLQTTDHKDWRKYENAQLTEIGLR